MISKKTIPPSFSILFPADSEINRKKEVVWGVRVDPGLKAHLQNQDMWDGQSKSGGDFFGGLLEKWRAANPSDETVLALRNLFHEDRGGLNLSQWLLEKFELRLYRGSLKRMIPKLRNYDSDKIEAGYAQGYEILNRALRDTHLWCTETSATEMNRLVEARPLSLILCAVAAGYSPQESPGWYLVIYDDGGNRILVEFPAEFAFDRFLSLHVEFMLRVLIAVLCREEIARRVLRYRFQAWILDIAFKENPKASYGSFWDEATRKVGKKNEDFISDHMAGMLDFLKNSPEHEAIRAALEQRFSEVAFYHDFLDHKKKAETRFHDQMESYRDEPGEDEQGRLLPPSPVDIIEVLESSAGIGQNTAQEAQGGRDILFTLTDAQKSALNERIGPQAADIIECMGMSPALAEDGPWRDVKWLNECAEERGISQDTMTRYKKLFQENADWVIELLDLKRDLK